MANNKWVNDYYTNKARTDNILARSYYKLQEIDAKFQLFDPAITRTVIDIWAAPWSWLQYCNHFFESLTDQKKAQQPPLAVWFDLKQIQLSLPYIHTFQQDITEIEAVKNILQLLHLEHESVDCIISDMAPDTIGMKDIDALRSVGLIEKTLWMYEYYLKPWWKFALKVFMGPWFDELVRSLKEQYGHAAIQTFKPKSCRKTSKETYIVKKA